jgi:hypothetical protein
MSITYTQTLNPTGLLNINSAHLFLKDRGSYVQFSDRTNETLHMTFGPSQMSSGRLESSNVIDAPGFRASNLGSSNGVVTTDATGNLQVLEGLTYDGTRLTVSGDLNVGGTLTVVNTNTVLIEDPIVQVGLSNILPEQEVGFIFTANASTLGSNVAIGFVPGTGSNPGEFVIAQTNGSASAGISGQLSPEYGGSINVHVYGNFQANYLYGDGSNLTGIVTGSSSNLQQVTTNGNVTADHITVGGLTTTDAKVNGLGIAGASLGSVLLQTQDSGYTGQDPGFRTVAIGNFSAETTQKYGATAVGNAAGRFNQGFESVAVGDKSGRSDQGDRAVAVGHRAGYGSQGEESVAMGAYAASNSQGTQAVAIGPYASQNSQGNYIVAIGNRAGQESQQEAAIAIGNNAGQTTQNSQAVAIGSYAGYQYQNSQSIAIGSNAGYDSQAASAVALGTNAGRIGQSPNAIAIGTATGYTSQGTNAIAMGLNAGNSNQANNAIAMGLNAGNTGQGDSSIALGIMAGNDSQLNYSVAVGAYAGQTEQNNYAVAIGASAGNNSQGSYAVAIGTDSGAGNDGTQGDYAVAVGYRAGYNSQHQNSIVLNASGSALDTGASGFFVKPIRNTGAISNVLGYDTATGEIYDTGYSANSGGGGGTQDLQGVMSQGPGYGSTDQQMTLTYSGNGNALTVDNSASIAGTTFRDSNVIVSGNLDAPGGTINAYSIVGHMITGVYSAAVESLNANEANITNLNVSGTAQINGPDGLTVDGNIEATTVTANVLAQSLNVSGPATFNGVTTVSVLKFTPGGIDPAIGTPVAQYTGFSSGKIRITATDVVYGSATVANATGAPVTGLVVTGLNENAHLYVYVNGSQTTFASPTDGYKYLSTVTGTNIKVMYHVFNVGGTIFVDMTKVN